MWTIWNSHLVKIWCLLVILVVVNGQSEILQVSCDPIFDGFVFVYINIAPGKFVYISTCTSTEGEFNGTGIPTDFLFVVIFRNCNIQWDVFYTIYLTETQGVVQGSDVAKKFMCVRETGPIAPISVGLTVSPSTEILLHTQSIQPNVFMKITDGVSYKDDPAVTFVGLGQMVRLHIWTDDVYSVSNPTGIDIMVKTIEVTNGGSVAVLTGVDGPNTYDGCKSKSYWADVQDIAVGYVMVEFTMFMLAPVVFPSYFQSYSADVDICVGSVCPNYACSLNGLGGPAIQAGRRKRSEETEEIRVTSQVTVVPFNLLEVDVPTPIAPNYSTVEPEITDTVQKCRTCTRKNVMHGIFAALATSICLSIVGNLLFYTRYRRILASVYTENDAERTSYKEESINGIERKICAEIIGSNVKSSDSNVENS